MKDLLKVYSPVAFVLAGAFVYWSIGTVGALRDTVTVLEEQLVAIQEQTKEIVIAVSGNCEAAGYALKPVEETKDSVDGEKANEG